ncbi:DUF3598 family protein [Microcoleus sp. FACHB-68]|uniref:DUF3598 family protein n=1 Tax=Microcoleus sp. FACHB-68 TaxID=2692826 RepID=UPI0016825A07|nr:DUF3598 family protein [Microcoleus sp. FACHB-68]MBD1936910.1 DUF3598 family protein [Microcoleus sp. FACHB-68]
MSSQWNNFLQNLGQWQGSFTQLSPAGELINMTPSVLFLEGLEDNQKVRLRLRRFAPDSGGLEETNVQEMVREYSSLGRDILFFENGAFSQGSIQLAPYAEFGAEFGFIANNNRLRLVQLFNQDGKLDKLTLIREMRAGTEVVERPPLTLDQLLGEWQGEAHTLYPDWRSPDQFSTTLRLQKDGADRVVQQLSFGAGAGIQGFTSKGRVEGKTILFDEGSVPVQVLMLPDGASSTCLQSVQLRQSFFLEAGWLIQPDLRQRLIRRYSDKGEWVSLTLVTERKIN